MLITENGETAVLVSGCKCVIYVAGDLGGGVATLGYMATTGFVSLKDDTGSDITFESGIQYEVSQGFGAKLVVKLIDATDPQLEVSAFGLD